MSREIKFRIFDGGMMEVARLDFYEGTGSYIFDNYVNMEQIMECFKLDEYQLMQYTGLKDINGVEIYEGDIVKYTHDWEVFATEDEIAKVEFTRGGFVPLCLPMGGVFYTIESDPFYEVIGNIHENPELLE